MLTHASDVIITPARDEGEFVLTFKARQEPDGAGALYYLNVTVSRAVLAEFAQSASAALSGDGSERRPAWP